MSMLELAAVPHSLRTCPAERGPKPPGLLANGKIVNHMQHRLCEILRGPHRERSFATAAPRTTANVFHDQAPPLAPRAAMARARARKPGRACVDFGGASSTRARAWPFYVWISPSDARAEFTRAGVDSNPAARLRRSRSSSYNFRSKPGSDELCVFLHERLEGLAEEG